MDPFISKNRRRGIASNVELSFGHVAQAPIEEVRYLPLFVLSVVAVVLMVAGFVGFNKRDTES